MSRRRKKRHPSVGASPGTLVIPKDAPPPKIRVMSYSPEGLEEKEISKAEELAPFRKKPGVSWIDVQGLGDETVLRKIAEIFAIHRLALEDVVNVPQRPKSEEYENQQFVVARMARVLEPSLSAEVDSEQISLFFGPGYVLTFQERYGDVFDPVRERIRKGKGLIRGSGSDYLAYALIDAVIDGYYPVMESLGEYLEDLENEVTESATRETLKKIHGIKRTLLQLRRGVWPQRDMVNSLIRDESDLVTDPVRMHLRDCYDHVVQIMDVVETYRELAGGMMDIYLSTLSNQMNEVMKTLTIIGTIFIPLTFVAGIYGMNFEYMPELSWKWAYPALWGVMLTLAGALLFYFRRRGWLGGEKKD